MQIDNFYFVVKDIKKSIDFYTKLLGERPSNITEDRWADWNNDKNKIYFGIISEDATGDKVIKGNNGVLGLYTDNVKDALKKCKDIGAEILYYPEEVPGSLDNYTCFAILDLDGNKIEISYYDK